MCAELCLTSLISNQVKVMEDTHTTMDIAMDIVMVTATATSMAISTVRDMSMMIRTVTIVVRTKRIRYEKKR